MLVVEVIFYITVAATIVAVIFGIVYWIKDRKASRP